MKDTVTLTVITCAVFAAGLYFVAWVLFGTTFDHMGVMP